MYKNIILFFLNINRFIVIVVIKKFMYNSHTHTYTLSCFWWWTQFQTSALLFWNWIYVIYAFYVIFYWQLFQKNIMNDQNVYLLSYNKSLCSFQLVQKPIYFVNFKKLSKLLNNLSYICIYIYKYAVMLCLINNSK